jgi:hypothetical protein
MFKKIWYALCTTCRPGRSSTVRLTFPMLTVALAFFGAAVLLEDKSYITISSSVESVSEGDAFFLTVAAVAHTPVNTVDIVIEYPEERMDIESVDTGQSVITLWAEDPYAEDGKIFIRGGTFRKGFVGEHHLVRIRARAVDAGSVNVQTGNVRFLAGDGLGTEVPVVTVGTEKSQFYITNSEGEISGTVEVVIVTDIDGDGKVTLSDLSRFMSAWGSQEVKYDFNGDGRMSFRDFGIILADSFFK